MTWTGSSFYASNGDQMVSLPNGSTPTYASCKADTVLVPTVSSNPGTAFCVIETTGKMAGVYVESVNSQPSYIVLRVWVWENAP